MSRVMQEDLDYGNNLALIDKNYNNRCRNCKIIIDDKEWEIEEVTCSCWTFNILR